MLWKKMRNIIKNKRNNLRVQKIRGNKFER